MGSSAGWRREPPGPGTATLTFMELLPPAPEELRTTAKRTSALLRDARLVQRRLDVLMTTAAASDDPSCGRIAEAREAVERLVLELTFRQHGNRRRLNRRRDPS